MKNGNASPNTSELSSKEGNLVAKKMVLKSTTGLLRLFFLLNFCLLSTGCGVMIPLIKDKDKLSHLDLLMSREEVRHALGEPGEVRGSVINVDGDVVTVWQYKLYEKSCSMQNLAAGFFCLTIPWWLSDTIWSSDAYWLYFVNDTLARWGRAGDWQPDLIARVRLDVNVKNK